MSVHPFPRRAALHPPVVEEPYYQTDRSAEVTVRLRPMTAIEQMYAYWGFDRE